VGKSGYGKSTILNGLMNHEGLAHTNSKSGQAATVAPTKFVAGGIPKDGLDRAAIRYKLVARSKVAWEVIAADLEALLTGY
jgi:hypothetical protein